MNILNKEELRRQIREGKEISLDGILDDLYGYELSEQTISNITSAILEKAKEWQNRPLEAIYPIIFMDATVLKIRVDSALP